MKRIINPLLIAFASAILFGGCTTTDSVKPQPSSLSYQNKTFTNISITVNNISKTILPGQSASFQGVANSAATGKATTSGTTGSGNRVGLLLSWNINNTFPSSGSQTLNLNIDSTIFYLFINNNSTYTVQKVFVNYGLANQTEDNISFGSGNYGIGYYQAYSNSNVRCESGQVYWYVSSLSLPDTSNQSSTITLTN